MDISNNNSGGLELTKPGLEVDEIEEVRKEILEKEFRDGQITPKGWLNDQGVLLPRAKNEARPGLSAEDELVIDQWNKAMQRDFPTVDIAWIDMISTYCYKHPEDSKTYALARMTEASTEGGRFTPDTANPFQAMDDQYQRVHS